MSLRLKTPSVSNMKILSDKYTRNLIVCVFFFLFLGTVQVPATDVDQIHTPTRHRLETCQVEEQLHGGVIFHVADYADGTTVFTCLDGDEKGWQGIVLKEQLLASSRDVEWENGYFVHFYPHGKVTSYPDQQIVELY